jgi:acyl carrier protein
MSEETSIRNYILENYLFTDDQSALNNEDSFLEKGVLDSTGILEVIYFLEETFDVKIDDDEMIPENLDSVNNIVAFIGRKKVVEMS